MRLRHNGTEVFSESVAQSSSRFFHVYLFAISASYAIDDIGGGSGEFINDLNGSLGSRYFLNVLDKRRHTLRSR